MYIIYHTFYPHSPLFWVVTLCWKLNGFLWVLGMSFSEVTSHVIKKNEVPVNDVAFKQTKNYIVTIISIERYN